MRSSKPMCPFQKLSFISSAVQTCFKFWWNWGEVALKLPLQWTLQWNYSNLKVCQSGIIHKSFNLKQIFYQKNFCTVRIKKNKSLTMVIGLTSTMWNDSYSLVSHKACWFLLEKAACARHLFNSIILIFFLLERCSALIPLSAGLSASLNFLAEKGILNGKARTPTVVLVFQREKNLPLEYPAHQSIKTSFLEAKVISLR